MEKFYEMNYKLDDENEVPMNSRLKSLILESPLSKEQKECLIKAIRIYGLNRLNNEIELAKNIISCLK